MTKEQLAFEALEAISGKKRCGIAVTMGGGKTYIALLHMARLYYPGITFLVVADKRGIFDTWKEEATKFNLEYLLNSITFSTYRSLCKQPHHFFTAFLDECHSLLFSHEPWLKGYSGNIVGLTGTPPRFQRSEKGIMIEKYCPIVYSYLTEEAIDDGLLNDYRIIIHHLQLGTTKNVQLKSSTSGSVWYDSEEKIYLFWHKRLLEVEEKIKQIKQKIIYFKEQRSGMLSTRFVSEVEDLEIQLRQQNSDLEQLRLTRMRALMEFPGKVRYAKWLLKNTHQKVLAFANTAQQADTICEHSIHYGNTLSEYNLEMFSKGFYTKASCIHMLNQGMNIPGLREAIVLHSYSNERKGPQRIGRLLRLNPDDISLGHILCYDGTIDESWVQNALVDFSAEKIYHYYAQEERLYNTHGALLDGIEFPWGFYTPPTYINNSNGAFLQGLQKVI